MHAPEARDPAQVGTHSLEYKRGPETESHAKRRAKELNDVPATVPIVSFVKHCQYAIMEKSTFIISKMDCPSEERLVRMKLDNFSNIRDLHFDLEKRTLIIFHDGQTNEIEKSIAELKLNSKKISTEKITIEINVERNRGEKRLLWTVLLINFGFFAIESITGLISKSMGLVADSLDMLADAFVYGMSLYAVGRATQSKKNVARVSGYFQITLAVTGFLEVIRRFVSVDEPPDYKTMIIVSIFALIANAICLYLLQRTKSKEAHIKASMIFTSNDVIINIGVILAGALVYILNSNKPDLIIGTIVFVIVTRGALRILNIARD
jgi:Co/Zn/Cd efflux system component